MSYPAIAVLWEIYRAWPLGVNYEMMGTCTLEWGVRHQCELLHGFYHTSPASAPSDIFVFRIRFIFFILVHVGLLA